MHLIKKIVAFFFNTIARHFGILFSYQTKPAYARDYNPLRSESDFSLKTAIIIQGPLLKDINFTLESIRLYKKILRVNTLIIVSTWQNEDEKLLAQIKDAGAIIVQSEIPAVRGISNINLQITSTLAGIKKARELDAEYILKTRTDTRLYTANIEEFLCDMLQQFPVASGYQQKQRIIGLGLNTFKYRLYDMSDIVLFGQIDDMTRYWDAPHDTRSHELPTHSNLEWSRQAVCEVFLSTHYLKTIGREPLWTLADSLDVFAKHFCVIDAEMLGLHWHKYAFWKISRRAQSGSEQTDQQMSFAEWLILYTGSRGTAPAPENIIQMPFGKKIKEI